jgi:preprotein translocase subunit YajC
MTPTLAASHFIVAATKSSSSSLITLLPLVAIGLLGYFFFIRPQQRKAQAARQGGQGTGYEVGDEVQTVGGVIGTVLEVHGDRYTLLTGALGDDGNLDGPQPTRIVFVRQAIAKKIEPIEDVRIDDEPVEDVKPARPASTGKGTSGTSDATSANGSASRDGDIDDVGGDGAASSGDLGGEAEEG